MSDADRDLVQAIRAELAAIDPPRPCDRDAERAGLGADLSARDAIVARLAVRLGLGTVDGERQVPGRRRTRHVRLAGAPEPPAWSWSEAADHCRVAWARGRFLAAGSLSLTGGRTHLEFVVPLGEAPELASRLAALELPASWRARRGRGVVTWKSAERVVHFLRLAGASGALLELEARAVARSLRGELNRVINAEAANLQRSVGAAARQLAAIELLEADGRLATLPYVVRLVADGRRDVPEASLGELAERLALHRSAVQRSLDRLERLASDDAPTPEARSRRRTAAHEAGATPA